MIHRAATFRDSGVSMQGVRARRLRTMEPVNANTGKIAVARFYRDASVSMHGVRARRARAVDADGNVLVFRAYRDESAGTRRWRANGAEEPPPPPVPYIDCPTAQCGEDFQFRFPQYLGATLPDVAYVHDPLTGTPYGYGDWGARYFSSQADAAFCQWAIDFRTNLTTGPGPAGCSIPTPEPEGGDLEKGGAYWDLDGVRFNARWSADAEGNLVGEIDCDTHCVYLSYMDWMVRADFLGLSGGVCQAVTSENLIGRTLFARWELDESVQVCAQDIEGVPTFNMVQALHGLQLGYDGINTAPITLSVVPAYVPYVDDPRVSQHACRYLMIAPAQTGACPCALIGSYHALRRAD